MISSGEVAMPCDEAQDVAKAMNDAICLLLVEHDLFRKKWDEGVALIDGDNNGFAQLDEVEPSTEDIRAIAMSQEPTWKTKTKLKNSPRKAVEALFKEVDNSVCGSPCSKVETRAEIAQLNREFTGVFP